ncbi:MAG TPA: hypothetical protein DCM45_02475 [Clostridiales bacterium]|nr:hypothetical protein [Clostridiales bacterium]
MVIKPLTPDLTAAYLDFFDHRAFSEEKVDNPNGPCYCNAPTMTTAEVRQVVSEFGSDIKGTLRKNAESQLAEGKLQGYLAFGGDMAVGYSAVEGYGEMLQERVAWDLHGPIQLYKKEGLITDAT